MGQAGGFEQNIHHWGQVYRLARDQTQSFVVVEYGVEILYPVRFDLTVAAYNHVSA